MKTRQSKRSFALAHAEVTNIPYAYFHKLTYITSHTVWKEDFLSHNSIFKVVGAPP